MNDLDKKIKELEKRMDSIIYSVLLVAFAGFILGFLVGVNLTK